MAIITPMKIRSAVILVKIPYTGPSCIPFIHCLAFDDFSYKRCIFGVSEGHYDPPHNAISVFLVCIPCSSATFGSKEILPVSLKINAFLNRPNIPRRKVFVLSDRLCRFSIVTTSKNPFFHDQYLSLKIVQNLTNKLVVNLATSGEHRKCRPYVIAKPAHTQGCVPAENTTIHRYLNLIIATNYQDKLRTLKLPLERFASDHNS